MNSNWFLKMLNSFFPWISVKGLQTEQTDFWLSPWKQHVLILRHLIHSGDYHLLKQWRGFRWSWRNGVEKFRWSRFSKCINRLCISFCILTWCQRKETVQHQVMLPVGTGQSLQKTTAMLYYEILRQEIIKKFKRSFQRRQVFIMIYF